jgi:hypothetical protein
MFHEILDKDGLYKTKLHEIHTENCDMHRVAANFVPRLLGEKHKIVCISVKSLSTVQMLQITFKKTSAQVMEFGFTAMMSKQKPSHNNGFQNRHPDPHKHGKFGAM